MSPVEQTTAGVSGPPAAKEATISVSIIIPALNEERMIGRCLESLAKLNFSRDLFEVILVDNGSSDRTIEIARSFEERIHLTVCEKTGVRISALRNLGAQTARGDILAFLDADCLAPQDWLERIVELTRAERAGILGSHYLLPQDSSWVGRTWHRYHEAEKSGDVSHVPAGDLIIRREDFLRLGGFDRRIQTNEDYELCERVRAAGMKVRAFPQLGVIHLGTAQNLRIFFRKQAWHGTHVVKVFLRNVSGSRNLKAVLFAGYTLLCLLGIVGGLVWSALNHAAWQFSLAGVAGLLLPPVVLSVKQVFASRKWSDFFPLMTLYLTYGIARAKALLNIRNLF